MNSSGRLRKTICIDANIIIEAQYNDRLKNWLLLNHANIRIPYLAYLEVYYSLFNSRNHRELFLAVASFELIYGSFEISDKAIKIAQRWGKKHKAQGRKNLAKDTIIAACAIVHKLPLLTLDNDFEGIGVSRHRLPFSI